MRVIFVASGFTPERRNQQPWMYVDRVTKGLCALGFDAAVQSSREAATLEHSDVVVESTDWLDLALRPRIYCSGAKRVVFITSPCLSVAERLNVLTCAGGDWRTRAHLTLQQTFFMARGVRGANLAHGGAGAADLLQ